MEENLTDVTSAKHRPTISSVSQLGFTCFHKVSVKRNNLGEEKEELSIVLE